MEFGGWNGQTFLDNGSDASGATVGSEILINQNTTGTQQTGRTIGSEVIAELSDGSIAVSWDTSLLDVYTRVFSVPGADGVTEDTVFTLPISITLSDTDGSETIVATTLDGLPSGFVLSDGGGNSATSDGSTPINIFGWNLSGLSVTPAANANGAVTVTVSTTSEEGANNAQATTVEDSQLHDCGGKRHRYDCRRFDRQCDGRCDTRRPPAH